MAALPQTTSEMSLLCCKYTLDSRVVYRRALMLEVGVQVLPVFSYLLELITGDDPDPRKGIIGVVLNAVMLGWAGYLLWNTPALGQHFSQGMEQSAKKYSSVKICLGWCGIVGATLGALLLFLWLLTGSAASKDNKQNGSSSAEKKPLSSEDIAAFAVGLVVIFLLATMSVQNGKNIVRAVESLTTPLKLLQNHL